MHTRLPSLAAILLLVLGSDVACAAAEPVDAVTSKAPVNLHESSSPSSPVLDQLKKGEPVAVTKRMGIWYQVTAEQKKGFLKVNEVSFASIEKKGFGSNLAALVKTQPVTNQSVAGGVRGLDESDLAAAKFNAAQLKQMESYRASVAAGNSFAAKDGWKAADVPWKEENESAPKPVKQKIGGAFKKLTGFANKIGNAGLTDDNKTDKFKALGKLETKSEEEKNADELAYGPEIAGRMLGAAPLWNNPQAQQRVNRIGRWLASQTSRPELPWTFGIIEAPEYNAFAAPGGYILITRGLYQLLPSDEELAAVLAHEVAHVVQRDHYHVIQKQQLLAGVGKGVTQYVHTSDEGAVKAARDFVEKNGGAIIMTSLDRGAEYRADRIGSVYLARAGIDPLMLYSVLQTMQLAGSQSNGLAQLYKTHPDMQKRMDKLDGGELDKLYQMLGSN